MGGSVAVPTSTTMENKVIFELPSAMLQIPQISTEQVISTSINFTAQGAASGTYDIEQNNEATITYYSSPAV
jgi:outer membrane receptor for ferric coprogen and ferric-rhodotorulic acid